LLACEPSLRTAVTVQFATLRRTAAAMFAT
jgi:hypothetical protein